MKKILLPIMLLIGLGVFAQTATGLASYYHNKFHGRRTSSGEAYHKDSFTCAHRSFPYGTRLKVTCLKTGKYVIVRVNDRGPNVRTRLIDLSYAAGREIGMIGLGVTKVKVERVD